MLSPRFELGRPFGHMLLRHACLPFHHKSIGPRHKGRTCMPLRATDFKSVAYAIPPDEGALSSYSMRPTGRLGQDGAPQQNRTASSCLEGTHAATTPVKLEDWSG